MCEGENMTVWRSMWRCKLKHLVEISPHSHRHPAPKENMAKQWPIRATGASRGKGDAARLHG